MSTLSIEALVNYPNEERWLEFKESMDFSVRANQIKIFCPILAMSNIGNGGWVIIGVREDDGTFFPDGMPQDDIDSFKIDDFKKLLLNYADPYALVDISKEVVDGKNFVVIQVHEFDDIPVICKKAYPRELKEGVIYTRTKGGKPESIVVPSQVEMREIINLAVDKNTRKLIARSRNVGLFSVISTPETKDAFSKQVEDLVGE